MSTVYILNDHPQGREIRKQIASALNAKFNSYGVADVSFSVCEFCNPINLRSSYPDDVARQVLLLKPVPDVLLIDCNMPDPGDAIRVVDSLRKQGFRGYTYLWSAANPKGDLQAQPKMFAAPGADGFERSNLDGLSNAVYQSWLVLKGFDVRDHEQRTIRNPMIPMLLLLSELQAGLFSAQGGDLVEANWRAACGRARKWFDSGFDSFCSAVHPFQGQFLDLSDANNALEELPNIALTDLPAIEALVLRLRDSLLEIVESCR